MNKNYSKEQFFHVFLALEKIEQRREIFDYRALFIRH